MKKLLYITVNSKPESLSASKTVGRAFVNRFLDKYPDFKVEKLHLLLIRGTISQVNAETELSRVMSTVKSSFALGNIMI